MMMSEEDIARLRGFYHLIFEGRHKMASEDFVELRRQFGGYMVQLDLSVLVPVCFDCCGERSFPYVHCELKEVYPWLSPNGWETDLLLLGMHPGIISHLKKDIEDGIDFSRGPWCYVCHQSLAYWEDEDPACRVYLVSFKTFFPFNEPDSHHVGRHLKQVIRQLYDHTCFACGRELEDDEMTVDHVVSKAHGGSGEELNLQLLCFKCNHAKADQPVDVIALALHFPLRPVPSDAYEGVTW